VLNIGAKSLARPSPPWSNMQQQTMRQFTLACCILGTAVFFGAASVRALGLIGVPATSLKLASSSIMILTLVLQLAFVIAQLSPAGRAPVPLRGFGSDAWPSVLIATGMPAVFWHNLAGFAGSPINLIMPGFVTPMVTMVLFLGGREIQQRTLRNRSERGQAPVA